MNIPNRWLAIGTVIGAISVAMLMMRQYRRR
jgi:hypothetical protein